MDAQERRESILARLSANTEPLNASTLGEALGVSRQIIVGDVALLRASHHPILSTNRGYLLSHPSNRPRRTILVQHSKDEIPAELYAIVDAGGWVLNTVIEHRVYGTITVDLLLRCRTDVDDLLPRFDTSSALLELTNGWHLHTIEAADESTLDAIEVRLDELGVLRRPE